MLVGRPQPPHLVPPSLLPPPSTSPPSRVAVLFYHHLAGVAIVRVPRSEHVKVRGLHMRSLLGCFVPAYPAMPCFTHLSWLPSSRCLLLAFVYLCWMAEAWHLYDFSSSLVGDLANCCAESHSC